jgi:signal transduction histidine kinase
MRAASVIGLITLAVTLALPAFAKEKDPFGSADEARALVAKAIQHIDRVGADKAYEDFTAKSPDFVDRDLYVIVYDLNGRVLAHGQNAKMVGKDNLEMKDADGKAYVRERIEKSAASPAGFWQEYKWTDPVTRKLMAKSTFTVRHNNTLVSVGIYKR